MILFRNREEAGRSLAQELRRLELRDPVVVALPRGGVPIGYEVARALGAPLDVVVVRKIGAPGNPEYGIGAVSEDGSYDVDPTALSELNEDPEEIEAVIRRESAEVRRRTELFRQGRPPADLRGRSVLLVDDGLATGVTAASAASFLRKRGPREIVLAVPVCAPRTARSILRLVDRVVCLEQPERFLAVGIWYEDFSQLSDEDVQGLLALASGRGSDRKAA
jgi:putative phosphoribosyl transferase